MPRITPYTRTILLDRANVGNISLASAAEGGQEAAGLRQEASRFIGNANQSQQLLNAHQRDLAIEQAEKEAEGKVEAQKRVNEQQRQIITINDEMKTNRQANPTGFSDEFDGLMQERLGALEQQFKAEGANVDMGYFRTQYDSLRTSFFGKNKSWESGTRLSNTIVGTEQVIDDLNRNFALLQNPSLQDFSQHVEQSRQFVLDTASKVLAPKDLQKLMEYSVDQAADIYFEDMLTKHPEQLKKIFDQKGEGFQNTIGLVDPKKIARVQDQIPRAIDAKRKAQQSEYNKARDLKASQYNLAIEVMQDDLNETLPNGDVIPGKTREQKLSEMLENIENDPMFSGSPEGIIKGNHLKTNIIKELKSYQENQEFALKGEGFASGQMFMNPTDKEDVKAFESYFEKTAPYLQQLNPQEKTTAITEMVTNARFIPKQLKGEIQRAARGQDPNEIAQTADLIDKIIDKNPYMINSIASGQDMNRLTMINQRINNGYEPQEAMRIVDDLLDPKKKPEIAVVKQEINDLSVDYRSHVMDTFDSAGIVSEVFSLGYANGLDVSEGPQKEILDRTTAAYKTFFDDNYTQTRDQEAAKNFADKMIKGRYSVSQINGGKQIMDYAPEMYYHDPARHGDDTGWMRKQVVDTVYEMLSKSMAPKERESLEDNLFVTIDPRVTPRTANQGAPRYKLLLKNNDGVFVDILGRDNFFRFDPEKAAQEQIKKAREDIKTTEEAILSIEGTF